MAFLRSLDVRCRKCERRAKFELVNYVNGVVGWFCGQHAKAALKDQEAFERGAKRLPTIGAPPPRT